MSICFHKWSTVKRSRLKKPYLSSWAHRVSCQTGVSFDALLTASIRVGDGPGHVVQRPRGDDPFCCRRRWSLYQVIKYRHKEILPSWIRKHGLFLVSNLLHEISGQYLETDFLHKVVYKFLERLDDPHNDFRILATRVSHFHWALSYWKLSACRESTPFWTRSSMETMTNNSMGRILSMEPRSSSFTLKMKTQMSKTPFTYAKIHHLFLFFFRMP